MTRGAEYVVRYLATGLAMALGEVLADLRPKPALAALVAGDWRRRGFPLGRLPAGWRARRRAIRCARRAARRFSTSSRQRRCRSCEPTSGVVSGLGHHDLDVAAIRGPDRRLTRLASAWAYDQIDPFGEPRYAGVRYLSRLTATGSAGRCSTACRWLNASGERWLPICRSWRQSARSMGWRSTGDVSVGCRRAQADGASRLRGFSRPPKGDPQPQPISARNGSDLVFSRP